MVTPTPGETEGEPTDTLDDLVELARDSLDREGVIGPIAVYLAVDRSTLLNGTSRAETATKRAVAFAAAAGCDNTTGGLFSSTVEATFSLTTTTWSGQVTNENDRLGTVNGVRYAPVVDWVAEHHAANRIDRPAFAIVYTVGQPDDHAEAFDALSWPPSATAGWDFMSRQFAVSLDAFDDAFGHVSWLIVDDDTTDEQVFDHMALALRTALETGS